MKTEIKLNKRVVKFPWMYYYTAIKNNLDDKIQETVQSLFKRAYKDFSIQMSDLGTRRRNFIEVNAVIAFVMKEHFRNLSLQAIGNIFGKNHATIIHYIDVYENILCQLPQYRKLHEKLSAIVMNDMYGIDQEINAKNKTWLKAECLRLSEENKELKKALENIKNFINS